MKLQVSCATAIFPTEIRAANDHSTYSVSIQDIFQPAVRFENIDLGELAWEVGHASRDDGDKDQLLAGAGLGEIGDGDVFRLYLGPLECSCTLGAGCRAATPVWTARFQFSAEAAVGVGGFVVGSPALSLPCAGKDVDQGGVPFHRLFHGKWLTQERLAFVEPTLVGDHCLVRLLVRSKFLPGELHRWKSVRWRHLGRANVAIATAFFPFTRVGNSQIWLQRKPLPEMRAVWLRFQFEIWIGFAIFSSITSHDPAESPL
jgi:hypothetical protein